MDYKSVYMIVEKILLQLGRILEESMDYFMLHVEVVDSDMCHYSHYYHYSFIPLCCSILTYLYQIWGEEGMPPVTY